MEIPINPKTVALQFNECINRRNLEGLVNLMTNDHTFIDSANNVVTGKSDNQKNWVRFFELFPDYQNVFESVCSKNSTVMMQGYSICPNEKLHNLRVIWTAQIEDNKVKEWRIYFDNEENKAILGI